LNIQRSGELIVITHAKKTNSALFMWRKWLLFRAEENYDLRNEIILPISEEIVPSNELYPKLKTPKNMLCQEIF